MFRRNSGLRTGVAHPNPMMGSGNVRDAHMASSNRFWRDTVHNHPVIVTTTAATAGVLLGGLFAVQLLDASQPVANNCCRAAGCRSEAKVEKPSAETTGSAPTGERTASAECERQTWPYLSGDCLDEYRRTHRAARVVSTDKLDKQTVESNRKPESSDRTCSSGTVVARRRFNRPARACNPRVMRPRRRRSLPAQPAQSQRPHPRRNLRRHHPSTILAAAKNGTGPPLITTGKL